MHHTRPTKFIEKQRVSIQRYRRKFDWVSTKLGINTHHDWTNITVKDIQQFKGFKWITSRYNGSLYSVFKLVYPEFQWKTFLKKNTSNKNDSNITDYNNMNYRQYVDEVAELFGVQSQEQLYKVETKLWIEKLNDILPLFDSLHHLFQSVYPEFQWYPFLFSKVPRNYWKSTLHQRNLLDWVAEQLNVECQEDWYALSGNDVKTYEVAGAVLANYHGGSLFSMLGHVYPEFEWVPIYFSSVPHNYWNVASNRRKFFDWMADVWNIETQEDWYKYTLHDAKQIGAANILLTFFNNSLFVALQKVYPEYEWDPKFINSIAPVKRDDNVWRAVLDAVGKSLNIVYQEDWYSVRTDQVIKNGGADLIEHFEGSLFAALQTLYPEYEWNPFLLHMVPRNFWKEKSNHVKMMDWIAENMNIQTQHDWYSVTSDDLKKYGAWGLLTDYHSGSVFNLLKEVYPQFEWSAFLYYYTKLLNSQGEKGISSHRQKLDKFGQQLGIQTQEDWYGITTVDMKMIPGGAFFINQHYNNSLFTALVINYPEFEWNPLYCAFPPHKFFEGVDAPVIKETLDRLLQDNQSETWSTITSSRIFSRISRQLGGTKPTLQTFYPDTLSMYDTHGETYLERMLKTISLVEKQKKIHGYSVDFYLPHLSLAFEFQGGQHYKQIFRGSLSEQQERDNRKREALKKLGVTLVEVPYWWNGSFVSLMNTIQKQDPDFNLELVQVET